MTDAIFTVPQPVNEPVLNFAPGSPEKLSLKKALADAKASQQDIPMFIGGKHVFSEEKVAMRPPHERKHMLGHYSKGNASHVKSAIDAAVTQRQSMREGGSAGCFSYPAFSVWGYDIYAHDFIPVIVFNNSSPSALSFQVFV